MINKKDSFHNPTHHRSKENETMDGGKIEAPRGETPNIPQEIIEEILVRLPARSLLKFRCVSKSWLSLISSPKFIKTHATYSTLDPALSNYRLVLGVSYDPIRDELNHDSVHSVVVRDLFTNVVKNIDCPSEPSEWGFRTNGSCNGLLCISVLSFYRDDDDVLFISIKQTFLWNPCLRISKKLPPPVTAQEIQNPNWVCKYSIGYDEPNDDYKVLGFVRYICTVSRARKLMVKIYSLKNDSWKRIGDFKGGLLSASTSVIFTNGKFHFLDDFNNGNSPIEQNIVSLDLANEAYGTILQPKCDKGYSSASLAILKGCISALYSYERDRADVWILKDYGDAESWNKLASIPYVDGPSSDYRLLYRLCIVWDGKYLFRCGSHRVVYDPKDNSFVYPQKVNIAEICSTDIYAESLVTLPI